MVGSRDSIGSPEHRAEHDRGRGILPMPAMILEKC